MCSSDSSLLISAKVASDIASSRTISRAPLRIAFASGSSFDGLPSVSAIIALMSSSVTPNSLPIFTWWVNSYSDFSSQPTCRIASSRSRGSSLLLKRMKLPTPLKAFAMSGELTSSLCRLVLRLSMSRYSGATWSGSRYGSLAILLFSLSLIPLLLAGERKLKLSFRIAFRALQGHAAVDHQHLAGDVAGVVAHQEAHALADVPAGAFDLQHRGLGALGAVGLGHAVAAIDHRRVHRPGADAVDPDPVLAVIDRHRLGESDHRGFRRRVGRQAARPERRDRGDVDDCAALGGLDHRRNGMLGQQE